MKKTFRRLLALLPALAMLFSCAFSSAEEKAEAIVFVNELAEPFYAADTLPRGFLPMQKVVRIELGTSGDDRETAVKADFEWYSEDYSPEEMEAFVDFREGNAFVRCDLLRTPGAAMCRVSAESERYTGSLEFTFQVIGFSVDPLTGTDEELTLYTSQGLLPEPDKLLAGSARITGEYEKAEYIAGSEGITVGSRSASVDREGVSRLFVRLEKRGCFTCVGVTVYAGYTAEERYGNNEPVTVRNFTELRRAVMETCSNRIRIASGFSFGKTDDREIRVLHGRTVTISPEEGNDGAVINGSLVLSGDAHVTFDGVTIQGTEGEYALEVKDGMNVTAGIVRGADSRKGNGGTAVFVHDRAGVKVAEAAGGSSASGLGGDGIFAADHASAEAGVASGGSSSQGVGGAGAVALGDSTVTVTGEVSGGNGGAAPGPGILPGLRGSVSTRGGVRNGDRIITGTPVNPDDISSYALLQNALRTGKTQILLAPQFSWNPGSIVPLFTLSEETVRVVSPDGIKPVKMKDARFSVCCGNWEFGAFDVTCTANHVPLYACGDASVSWTGTLRSSRKPCVNADGSAVIRVSGNLEGTHRESVTVLADTRSRIEVTGNVSSKGANAAAVNQSSSLSLNGNVTMAGKVGYPAVYARGGRLTIDGNVTAGGGALECHGSDVRVRGTLSGKTKDFFILLVDGGTVSVDGTVNGRAPWSCSSGHLYINGSESTEP